MSEAQGDLLAGFDPHPCALSSVALREVSITFGRRYAVYRVSCSLRGGEVVALLGDNGAGKTTLLRAMASLIAPHEGEIRYDDAWDVRRDRAALRAHLGLIAHESLLHPELSGRENLALSAALRDVPTREVASWLELTRLVEAADRPVATYSRGMRQRLSVARALLHRPSVVLCDEPLTGLDRRSQALFWEVVAGLKARGRLVVVVTHQLDVPVGALDRMLLLRQGRLVADLPVEGSLRDTLDRAEARGAGGGDSRSGGETSASTAEVVR